MKLGHINRDILMGATGNNNVAKKHIDNYALKDLSRDELLDKVFILELDNEELRTEIRYVKQRDIKLQKNHLYFGICIGIVLTILFAYVL